jgi:hypothetical protein
VRPVRSRGAGARLKLCAHCFDKLCVDLPNVQTTSRTWARMQTLCSCGSGGKQPAAMAAAPKEAAWIRQRLPALHPVMGPARRDAEVVAGATTSRTGRSTAWWHRRFGSTKQDQCKQGCTKFLQAAYRVEQDCTSLSWLYVCHLSLECQLASQGGSRILATTQASELLRSRAASGAKSILTKHFTITTHISRDRVTTQASSWPAA